MVSDWIGQVVETIAKIAPPPLLACGIATLILLFVPDHLAQTLGVNEFRTSHRNELGGTFIFSWSYLAAHFIWWLRKVAADWWKSRKAKQVREQQLHTLTPEEKSYLAPYVLENANTQYFRMEDGIAGGLQAKRMLFQSSNVFNILEGLPYNIQPWVKEYLTEHPELLEGAAESEGENDL